MKFSVLSLGLALLFLASAGSLSAQCIANAGNDTAICDFVPNAIHLGGNPTATGGVEPYTYKWEFSKIYYDKFQITASDILDNTTTANPRIKSMGSDTVTLTLTVTDGLGNKCMDSVTIYYCGFVMSAADIRFYIKKGDSVDLYHNNVLSGCGITSIEWTPDYNISDRYISNPKVWPDSFTVYEAKFTDRFGCSVSDFIKVYVSTTSVSPLVASDFKMLIFPNPMSYRASVIIDNPGDNEVLLQFYDALGRLVYESKVAQSFELDAAQFSKGFYLYMATENGKLLASGKLVVN